MSFSKFRSEFFTCNRFIKFFKSDIPYFKKNFPSLLKFRSHQIASLSNTKSRLLYNSEANNFKTLLAYDLEIETVEYDLIN